MLLSVTQKMHAEQRAENKCLIKLLCNYLLISLMSQFYQLKVCKYTLINIIFLLGNLRSPDLLKSFAIKHYRR